MQLGPCLIIAPDVWRRPAPNDQRQHAVRQDYERFVYASSSASNNLVAMSVPAAYCGKVVAVPAHTVISWRCPDMTVPRPSISFRSTVQAPRLFSMPVIMYRAVGLGGVQRQRVTGCRVGPAGRWSDSGPFH